MPNGHHIQRVSEAFEVKIIIRILWWKYSVWLSYTDCTSWSKSFEV